MLLPLGKQRCQSLYKPEILPPELSAFKGHQQTELSLLLNNNISIYLMQNDIMYLELVVSTHYKYEVLGQELKIDSQRS